MNKFKSFRDKVGLTQEKVAEELSVTQGAISQWETNICFPKTELLPKLARIYNCSVDELLKIQH